jgi:hypothetical protein
MNTDEELARQKGGESIETDTPYPGFLSGRDVIFKAVDRINYPDFFGWALWLYKGDSFRVWQLIYPSTAGTWPWDPHPPAGYAWGMLKLYPD